MELSSIQPQKAISAAERTISETTFEIVKQCGFLGIDAHSLPRNFKASPENNLSAHLIIEDQLKKQKNAQNICIKYKEKKIK